MKTLHTTNRRTDLRKGSDRLQKLKRIQVYFIKHFTPNINALAALLGSLITITVRFGTVEMYIA